MARRALVILAALVGILGIARVAVADPAWQWPLQPPPTVVESFDPPAHPWLPGQRGVDLAGRVGETVHAAGAGLVSFAGVVAGVPVVAVRHPDGLETTYEPVDAVVRVGQHVAEGTAIGRLVLAGSQCAPAACLHWGVRRGVDYLDPLGLVGRGRVRLLPFLTGTARPAWLRPAVAATSASGALGGIGFAGLAVVRRRRGQPRQDVGATSSREPPGRVP